MFCIHCGSQIPDGSTFCTSCGNRLVPAEAPAPVAPPHVDFGTEVLSDPTPYFEPETEDTVSLADNTSVLDFDEDVPAVAEMVAPIHQPVAQEVYEQPVFQAPVQEAFTPPIYQPPVQETFAQPAYQPPVQEQPAPPVASAPEPKAPQTVYCSHCSGPISADTAFCPTCGMPHKPSKKKISAKLLSLIIGGGLAAMLIITVIIGLCSNWFGLYGPGTKIAAATNKTLKAGSFTIETKVEDGGDELEFTLYVVADMDKRELTIYGIADDADDQYELAIYDGYYINHTVYASGREYYDYYSIEDELDDFFEAYESTKDMDLEELFDMLDDETDGEASEILDPKATVKCTKKLTRKFNSNKWLKDNAGFSTSKENGVKLYKFSPKTYTLLNASLECYENAFVDEDDYEDMMDGLKDSKKYINEIDVDLTLGTKGGKLVFCEVKSDDFSVEMEFTHIGSTTIDEDDLEDLLREAKEHNSGW